MQRSLEYITELTMQIISVIKREIECLRSLDEQKFKDLQGIEGELLILLEEVRLRMREESAGILFNGSPHTLERLDSVFLELDRCLEWKHDLMKRRSSEISKWFFRIAS
ncbi:MAG: hypothetical protein ACTJLK_03715 [Anaplasma sp.]